MCSLGAWQFLCLASRDDVLWQKLLGLRYPCAGPALELTRWAILASSCWRDSYIRCWRRARDRLCTMPWLSARVLVEANVCIRDPHTPKCSTLAWPGRCSHYVSECELASCVEGVREEIRNGRFTVEDVADWLGSASASSQPLQQLAAIAALHADLDAGAPEVGPHQHPEVAARGGRVLALLGSKVEALQNQRVQLKYYTFLSRAERGCIGFRARDEVHSRRCACACRVARSSSGPTPMSN